MKRIVLVTHYFPSHRGGIEVTAGRLAHRLVECANVSVRWFASDCTDAPARTSEMDPHPVRSSNVVERRAGLPYPLWSPSGIASVIKAIRGCDIVHVHEYIYLGSLAAIAAASWHRKPIVVTQHIGVIPYRSRVLKAILELLNRSVGRIVLSRADRTVFISDSVGRYFSGFVKFRQEPLYRPNGIDTSVFFPVSDGERRRAREFLGVDGTRPLAIFVGRFVEKKGLQLLQEFASRTPDIDWLFAGWGPLHPAHWKLPNVTVLEGREGNSLRPVYQAADLLVLPSVGEGFPLVVQETMACGTPALVGIETANGNESCRPLLYVESLADDVTTRWPARIRSILSDREALTQRRRDVAKFASENWSIKATAEWHLALFETLNRKDF